KINLSAQVLAGLITRDEALEAIAQPFDSEQNLRELKAYVIKKLDLDEARFDKIFVSANKNYRDYPSDYNLVYKNVKYVKWLIRLVYDFKPMSIDSNEMIKS
ncbi:UNVERIFIED_CONTAM: hypothetical protein IGO34_24750, partial [Salmonella enterica subsp. enterica serovar Weltevreden]